MVYGCGRKDIKMWKIKQIFDGEYGCEEIQPGEDTECVAVLEDENGNTRSVPVKDRWLRENRLDEGSIWDREIFDVCDEEGIPLGSYVERTYAHEKGICHRTAHVWIYRVEKGRYQVLLQKRSMNKDSFPGKYDTSSAGHIPAGDEPEESAIRELYEELGIKAAKEQLHYAGTFRVKYEKEFHGKIFKDNEVAKVYCYSEPVAIEKLKLQKEEIESADWFDLKEVYDACTRHDERFCVPMGGLKILMQYLSV